MCLVNLGDLCALVNLVNCALDDVVILIDDVYFGENNDM